MFGLCHLFGLRFAPRIRDLKDRRLYLFPGQTPQPILYPLSEDLWMCTRLPRTGTISVQGPTSSFSIIEVSGRCFWAVERSRYAESLSDEREPSISLNVVPKPRMLLVPTVYVLGPLHLAYVKFPYSEFRNIPSCRFVPLPEADEIKRAELLNSEYSALPI